MQAFLEYVVKGLVNHPEAVTVTPVVKDALTIYELRMHPDDVGKVIGRQGMTINALRSLLAGGQRQEIVALLPGNRGGKASGIA